LRPSVGRQRRRRWRLRNRRRRWRLGRLDRLALRHLVLEIGLQRGEFGLERLFLASASSSEAFSAAVGSVGGSGAGRAGVSRVVRFVDGSIGAQARRNHEAISNANSSNRPNSSAAASVASLVRQSESA